MDATVNQKAEILAAIFTLEELERMMDVAVKAAEQQQQQQQQGAVSSAVIPTTAEMVDDGRPKKDKPAEPDIQEWMR